MGRPARVHLNIGSNQGDRHRNIAGAVSLIALLEGVDVCAVSDPVVSRPWGFDSSDTFVNVGAVVATTLAPEALLDRLQEIERRIAPDSPHRNADGTYRDRAIDIDIIAWDELIIDLPRLAVPHPLMHLRRFVLEPMAGLDPGWRHPRLGLTAAALLAQCPG